MKSLLDNISNALNELSSKVRIPVDSNGSKNPYDNPTDTNFFDKLDWSMRVRISTIVRAAVPDDDSDTYTQQVHLRLMADQTINSYALDLTPDRTDFSLVEADVPLGIISQDFIVRYRTSRSDLTAA